jgi:hypothetical protein
VPATRELRSQGTARARPAGLIEPEMIDSEMIGLDMIER